MYWTPSIKCRCQRWSCRMRRWADRCYTRAHNIIFRHRWEHNWFVSLVLDLMYMLVPYRACLKCKWPYTCGGHRGGMLQ